MRRNSTPNNEIATASLLKPDRVQEHTGFSRTEVNQPSVGCNLNAAGRVAAKAAARSTRRLSGSPRERGATARRPFLLFRSQPGWSRTQQSGEVT